MKKVFAVIIITGLLFTGCATTGTQTMTWEQTATTAYELTGATLTTAKTLLDVACDAKTIDTDKCTQYKDVYKKAQIAYVGVGVALETAIKVSDKVEQQKYIESYTVALANLAPLAAEVVKIVAELQK
jgi:hypothetical protein